MPAYYEVHVGQVAGDNDPEKRGRLMVKLPTVIDGDYPDWVDPCFPFAGNDCGFFFIPPVGTAIECEVYRGKNEDVSIDTPQVRWRAALYNRVDQIPEEFRDEYPKVMGIKSPGGHVFIMGDVEGKEYLQIIHSKKKNTMLVFDRNGSVAMICEGVKSKKKFGIFFDATKGAVELRGISTIKIASSGHIHIAAPCVTIQGRPVLRNGEPI